MKKYAFWTILVFMLSGMTGIVYAEDFRTALEKTMSEIPDGGDIAAMGNASTAVLEFSSSNPAIIAAGTVSGIESDSKVGACADFGFISFRNGLRVKTGFFSGTMKLPAGFVQLSVSDARSNEGDIDEFSNMEFDNAPSASLQYGLKLAENFYGGVSYKYSQSKVTSNVAIEDEESGEPFVLELTSKSKGHEVGFGTLYRLGKVNLGAFYAHSWDKSKEYADGFLESEESTHADQIRVGASIQLTPMTMVAADWRYFWFPEGECDSQFFAGLEQYVVKDVLAVYGGYANGGLTTGLGIYFEKGGLNLGYMYRPFRSTEEFLGKAEMFEALVYWNF